MNIKSNMPKDFYKLFSSKYLDYYQLAVVALYEESSQSYSVLGLTEEELLYSGKNCPWSSIWHISCCRCY